MIYWIYLKEHTDVQSNKHENIIPKPFTLNMLHFRQL